MRAPGIVNTQKSVVKSMMFIDTVNLLAGEYVVRRSGWGQYMTVASARKTINNRNTKKQNNKPRFRETKS